MWKNALITFEKALINSKCINIAIITVVLYDNSVLFLYNTLIRKIGKKSMKNVHKYTVNNVDIWIKINCKNRENELSFMIIQFFVEILKKQKYML